MEWKKIPLGPQISGTYRAARFWIKRNVPFGLRTLIGLALIVGGIFGFLPILGFWMIPLGFAVIMIDWSAISKWRRRQLARRRSDRGDGSR